MLQKQLAIVPLLALVVLLNQCEDSPNIDTSSSKSPAKTGVYTTLPNQGSPQRQGASDIELGVTQGASPASVDAACAKAKHSAAEAAAAEERELAREKIRSLC